MPPRPKNSGWVNNVVPQEEVMPTAIALAESLAQKPAISIAAALHAIHRGMDASIDDGLAIEEAAFRGIVGDADVREGVDAFVEKRPPRFLKSDDNKRESL